MIEQRKFRRVRFDARCILLSGDSAYEGRVVNISPGGAMISFNDSAIIPQGEKCLCRIFAQGNDTPAEIEVNVVYSVFACISVEFLAFDENSHPQLFDQIEELNRNPARYRVAYP